MKSKERQQVFWIRDQAKFVAELVEAGRFTEAISRAIGIAGTARAMLESGGHLTPTTGRARRNSKVLSGGASSRRGNGG